MVDVLVHRDFMWHLHVLCHGYFLVSHEGFMHGVWNFLDHWIFYILGVRDMHRDLDWILNVLGVCDMNWSLDVLDACHVYGDLLDHWNMLGVVDRVVDGNFHVLVNWHLDVLYVLNVNWHVDWYSNLKRDLVNNGDLDDSGVVDWHWYFDVHRNGYWNFPHHRHFNHVVDVDWNLDGDSMHPFAWVCENGCFVSFARLIIRVFSPLLLSVDVILSI